MFYLNKLFKSIVYLKKSNIRKRLIMSTSFLILLLISVNLIFFYITTKNNYIQQLKSSNENLINQIGFSYEMVIKNVKTSIYKTALSDMELSEMVRNYVSSFDYKNKIFYKLYNIMLSNEYIDSVYLYIPGNDQVFSTSNNIEKISSYENFSDQAAFSFINNKQYYTLGPRTVEYNRNSKQILSVVSSVPLYNQHNTAFLVANINLDQLRYNMMVKFKTSQNMNFYVVNEQNAVVIAEGSHNKPGDVLENFPSNKISYKNSWRNVPYGEAYITSTYKSDSLKWHFVLENSIDTGSSIQYAKTLVRFFTVSICLLLASLIIITVFTRPVKKITTRYNEKLWKDFVTDNIYFTDEVKSQLNDEWCVISNAKFGMIVLRIQQARIADETLGFYKLTAEKATSSFISRKAVQFKSIITGKDSITLIICFPGNSTYAECEKQLIELSEAIYNEIHPESRSKIYLAISTIKENMALIPSLYRECTEIFKYRLICRSHLLIFSTIKNRKEIYEYPYLLERQLINNLAIANLESCMQIIDEIFLQFENPNIKVEDNEIIRVINCLKKSILKINSVPISVKDVEDISISAVQSMDEIKKAFENMIEKICTILTEKNNDEKSKLYDAVLDYIDRNYTNPDISLCKVADTFRISRNYVSRIINETFKKSFTDYVNGKRIALAKEMLKNNDKSIKDIGEEVGFNYSYYFIKIFKNSEGITPGEYRISIRKSLA